MVYALVRHEALGQTRASAAHKSVGPQVGPTYKTIHLLFTECYSPLARYVFVYYYYASDIKVPINKKLNKEI